MRHIIMDPNEVVLVSALVFEERLHQVDPVAVVLFGLYFLLLALWIFCFSALVRERDA